eukprot:TRINITY_DN3501_c0_g1_i1.p1 TRINITY_DN3501_c0_g1~~TRINITY_DN3501_c0_g1_i1.p1  ORF type:complete len:318 (-),score=74.39 TRINITY_DN3501_c0_g1_i1:87-1040(-)
MLVFGNLELTLQIGSSLNPDGFFKDARNWADFCDQMRPDFRFEGRRVTALLVRSQTLSKAEWRRVFRVVGGSHIERLSLQRCSLKDAGAAVFATEVLRKHAHLQHLSVWDCGVGFRGMADIARALMTNRALRLQSLELPRNPIGVQGAHLISSMLQQTLTLRFLNLKNCGLSGCKGVREGMAKNYTVTELIFTDEEHPLDPGASTIAYQVHRYTRRNQNYLLYRALQWSPHTHCEFPRSLQEAAATCLLAKCALQRDGSSTPLVALPLELWGIIFEMAASAPCWYEEAENERQTLVLQEPVFVPLTPPERHSSCALL